MGGEIDIRTVISPHDRPGSSSSNLGMSVAQIFHKGLNSTLCHGLFLSLQREAGCSGEYNRLLQLQYNST